MRACAFIHAVQFKDSLDSLGHTSRRRRRSRRTGGRSSARPPLQHHVQVPGGVAGNGGGISATAGDLNTLSITNECDLESRSVAGLLALVRVVADNDNRVRGGSAALLAIHSRLTSNPALLYKHLFAADVHQWP